MRAIRTTTISILAVGLLAGLAVGVAAQDEDGAPGPEAATLVSGLLNAPSDLSMDCGHATFEDTSAVQGHRRERGRVCGNTTDMSDERLRGDVTFRDNADRYDLDGNFSDIVWGTISIVNEDGTWEGTSVGTSDITNEHLGGITYHELVGTGDYDGLSAILFVTETDAFHVSGVIIPGVLSEDR